MKINIKATGIELTPAISDYASKKVSMIEKYLDPSADVVAQVEVGKSSHHHKSGEFFRAEIHLTGSGLDLYAESEQTDLYAAIDLVKDDVAQSLAQKKSKTRDMARRGAQAVKNMMKGLNFFKKND